MPTVSPTVLVTLDGKDSLDNAIRLEVRKEGREGGITYPPTAPPTVPVTPEARPLAPPRKPVRGKLALRMVKTSSNNRIG